MVIKYKFLDNTTSEVEVDDELGKHITAMDEADYNLNRKETRRHDYISELEEKGRYITDDSDPLYDILKAELHEALMAAIEKSILALEHCKHSEVLIFLVEDCVLPNKVAVHMSRAENISKRIFRLDI